LVSFRLKLDGPLTFDVKCFGFVFVRLLLAVCLLISTGYAEYLKSHLSFDLQKINKSNPDIILSAWKPLIQIAKLPFDLWKTGTHSRVAVKCVARTANHSESNEVPAFEVEEENPVLFQDTNSVVSSLQKHNFSLVRGPNTRLGHLLWRDRISNPVDKGSDKSRSELEKIIEQIQSVEIKPRREKPEPIIVIEPEQQVEPNETIPGKQDIKEFQAEETEAEQKILDESERQDENLVREEPENMQSLQILGELLEHPEQLNSPLKLAEILYRSGHLKEAAKCYQEALYRMATDDAAQKQHRAWILFQIGNCLRNDDQQAAIEMYRQLITEYPNSPWSESARVEDKLLNWIIKDDPKALIDAKKF